MNSNFERMKQYHLERDSILSDIDPNTLTETLRTSSLELYKTILAHSTAEFMSTSSKSKLEEMLELPLSKMYFKVCCRYGDDDNLLLDSHDYLSGRVYGEDNKSNLWGIRHSRFSVFANPEVGIRKQDEKLKQKLDLFAIELMHKFNSPMYFIIYTPEMNARIINHLKTAENFNCTDEVIKAAENYGKSYITKEEYIEILTRHKVKR